MEDSEGIRGGVHPELGGNEDESTLPPSRRNSQTGFGVLIAWEYGLLGVGAPPLTMVLANRSTPSIPYCRDALLSAVPART